jgi:hypothetical protein
MQRPVILAAIAALIAGCSPPAEDQAANQAAAKPPPEKAPHCFFKDSETKDWAVRVEGDQAVVTGRAFRSDARYKAVLLEPRVSGGVAVVRPSITNNDTGFAAEGNWWDVKTAIPAAGLASVEVRCGKALIATLPLAKPAG